jgi:N-acetylglucosamine-6-sulfatase
MAERASWSLRRSAARGASHVVLIVGLMAGILVGTGGVAHPSSPGTGEVAHPSSRERPNILFVLTDDQRWDELEYMPQLQERVIGKGVTFSHGVVSNPLCCPSRSTILTGQYSGTNGVWNNNARTQGGWPTFYANGDESHTIAVALHDADYHTGMIGKYMNGYGGYPEHVPAGWDRWFALTNGFFFGPSASDQGVLREYDPKVYQTDLLGQQAVDFIDSAPSDKPLFLYWAPHAPHLPATPAPRDGGTLASEMSPWRPPSYDEADMSDKPWYMQEKPLWTPAQTAQWDATRQNMYESLISVDRWLGQIIAKLASTGRLRNTLIVFTSDNGFLLGEHRRTGKVVPYEESIRVPFIMRWDAAGWTVPATKDHLVSNVDFAHTFATAAGTSVPGDQGEDLVGLIEGDLGWRPDILLEHYQGSDVDGATGLSYCGIRTARFMYTQYYNGVEELYDLEADPYELTNLAGDPDRIATLKAMRAKTHLQCDPLPPDFHLLH